jgi:hypothetical protein
VADVFISYSRLDHHRVQPIADRLTSLGYAIWWDKHLRAGQVFVDEIERQLDLARAVLTVWSHNARNSTWVYAESSRAADSGKFLQVRLDAVQPPLPFDAMHCADMTGAGEWGPLEHALNRVVRQGAAPDLPRRMPQIGPLATPAPVGAPKLITAATTTTLMAYAGALTATYGGAMTPDQLQIALLGMIGVGGACAALSTHWLISVKRAGG